MLAYTRKPRDGPIVDGMLLLSRLLVKLNDLRRTSGTVRSHTVSHTSHGCARSADTHRSAERDPNVDGKLPIN